MSVVNFGFGVDKRVDALTVRLAELEARQARIDKALARQRRINEALLAVIENTDWVNIQTVVDKALAIE